MGKYGIISLREFKERTMAVASGEYKPSPDEPGRFFESQETADQYFSEKNMEPMRNLL